ncbi:MAG: NAD(+)/NADH kinase [Planctomycetes bacterium]|nr:NAD(+)/NADH kinase [Planctomycetota bacterium]
MSESPAKPPRRVLVIANPISGGGRGKVRAAQLADALRARGLTAECHFTTAAGDAGARARAAADEDWQTLVAVGGDGTVNEVLNGMPDPSRPLAVLPVGTANVLALELGLPKDPQAAAAAIAAGRCRSMTIGVADDRRFLLFCGVGVDGAVVAISAPGAPAPSANTSGSARSCTVRNTVLAARHLRRRPACRRPLVGAHPACATTAA